MKETLTIRKRYNSNAARARGDLDRFAEIQLDRLVESMEFNNIDQDSRSFTFADGSYVRIFRSYGLDYVDTYVPDTIPDDILDAVVEASIRKRFFIEIEDPEFSYETHQSHSLYWVVAKASIMTQLLTKLELVSGGHMTPEAINAALDRAMVRIGAKIGKYVLLIPFDFTEIEQYYPTETIGGEEGKWTANARWAFREAKSFRVEFDADSDTPITEEYIGYNKGSLINSTQKEAYKLVCPGLYKNYQQFHKLGDYLHWYGVTEYKDPGAPLQHNLLSKSYKLGPTSAEKIIELGSFFHGDYRMVVPGEGGLTKVDTDFGNIFATLTPPVETNGLVSIDDTHVTLHLYGGVDMAHVSAFAESGSIGAEGQLNTILKYEHGGGKASDPSWVYENVEGEVSTGYHALLWGRSGDSEKIGWTYEAYMPKVEVVDVDEDNYSVVFASGVVIDRSYTHDKSFVNQMERYNEEHTREDGWSIYRYILKPDNTQTAESVWRALATPVVTTYAAHRGGFRFELVARTPTDQYTIVDGVVPKTLISVIGSGFSFISDVEVDTFQLEGKYNGPHGYSSNHYSEQDFYNYINCEESYCDGTIPEGSACGMNYFPVERPPTTEVLQIPAGEYYGDHETRRIETEDLGDCPIRSGPDHPDLPGICRLDGYASVQYDQYVIIGCLQGEVAPSSGVGASPQPVSSGSNLTGYLKQSGGGGAVYGLDFDECVEVASASPPASEWQMDIHDTGGPYNLTNPARVTVRQTTAIHSSTDYEEASRIMVYLEDFELVISGYLSVEGRLIENTYGPQYAVLDDSACSGDVLVFVATCDELHEELNNFPIDNWYIVLQQGATAQVDIFDDIFDTLQLDKTSPDQIIDMGMF